MYICFCSFVYVYCIRFFCIVYELTPYSRVFLEKLTVSQQVKKFPTLHGTWTFITAITSARHLFLFWTRPTQSIPPHPTYWRTIWILSFHLCLGLPSGFFPSGFPTKNLYAPLPRTCYMPRPSNSFWFDNPNDIWWWVQIIKLLTVQSSPLPWYLLPLRPKYSP
jgi:hypothetical protein